MMDIKTQAEIRRKKILANAEARLRKITGKPVQEEEISKGPHVEDFLAKPVNGSMHNGSCSRDQHDKLNTAPIVNDLSSHDFLYNQLDSSNTSMPFDDAHSSLSNNVEEKRSFRYDCLTFLGLGILIRFLFYLKFSWLFFNNIIGPFIIACIPKLSNIFNRDMGHSGIYGILIMALSNHRRLYIFFKIVFALRSILQFFALYFLSFLISEYILSPT